jgi:hypothetical protein
MPPLGTNRWERASHLILSRSGASARKRTSSRAAGAALPIAHRSLRRLRLIPIFSQRVRNMNLLHWCAAFVARPRTVTTPTAASLLAAGALLGLALLLPDRAADRASAATEVPTITIAPSRPQRSVSLRDRLVVGLQARLKSELEFVELVALRVETAQLPQRLVDETFFCLASGRPSGARGEFADRSSSSSRP